MYSEEEYNFVKNSFETGIKHSEKEEDICEQYFNEVLNSNNYEKILFDLSDQYLKNGDKDLGRQCLELLSRVLPEASYRLGILYLDGVFGDGTLDSQLNNNEEHSNGIFENNGNSDYETAIYYFNEAANENNKDAQNMLKFFSPGKCPTRFAISH